MTEWEFVGDAKEWIALALVHNTELQFSGAKLEQRGSGSNKRRDLTLLDKSGRAVITGEVKMPYAPDGTSPFRSDVVTDARKKAERAGVKYFFTWNVNQCVLWETATAGAGGKRGGVRHSPDRSMRDQCTFAVRLAVDQSPKASGDFSHPGGHAAATRCVSWLLRSGLPTYAQAVGNAPSCLQYLRENLST